MDKQIVNLRRMLERWKRESDRFFSRPENEHYEPNGDVSHIWANFCGAAEEINDILEDFPEG